MNGTEHRANPPVQRYSSYCTRAQRCSNDDNKRNRYIRAVPILCSWGKLSCRSRARGGAKEGRLGGRWNCSNGDMNGRNRTSRHLFNVLRAPPGPRIIILFPADRPIGHHFCTGQRPDARRPTATRPCLLSEKNHEREGRTPQNNSNLRTFTPRAKGRNGQRSMGFEWSFTNIGIRLTQLTAQP